MPETRTLGPGAKLRAAREAAGLDRSELATRLGTTPVWIGRFENGKPITLDKVWEIAQAIGCDPHSIDPRLTSTKPNR